MTQKATGNWTFVSCGECPGKTLRFCAPWGADVSNLVHHDDGTHSIGYSTGGRIRVEEAKP